MDKSVTAICRKCGNTAPAGEFRIDLDVKMMVCPTCFRAKHPKKIIKNIEPSTPKDWDSIDEQLAARAAGREASVEKLREIGDSGKVRYACRYCRFKFTYNTLKKTPHFCPYCNKSVPELRAVKVS